MGERVTKNFVIKIYDFLDLLSEYPEIGSIENKQREIRGFTIAKQVKIFYRTKEDKIILLNFFGNSQNPKRKKY